MSWTMSPPEDGKTALVLFVGVPFVAQWSEREKLWRCGAKIVGSESAEWHPLPAHVSLSPNLYELFDVEEILGELIADKNHLAETLVEKSDQLHVLKAERARIVERLRGMEEKLKGF